MSDKEQKDIWYADIELINLREGYRAVALYQERQQIRGGSLVFPPLPKGLERVKLDASPCDITQTTPGPWLYSRETNSVSYDKRAAAKAILKKTINDIKREQNEELIEEAKTRISFSDSISEEIKNIVKGL